jgi:recombination protein RecA
MQKILDDLVKSLGAEKVYKASEVPDVEVISTGSLSLDLATGVGGIPKGSLVEIFGKESIGKTSLAYYMIAEAQKNGGFAAFVNLEGRLDAGWAQKIAGLDPDRLLVVAPNPGTEAVDTLGKLVDSGGFDLIVFDSIGAMLGDKEQKPGEAKQVGGQSALVTNMVKMVLPMAQRNKCTVIFLNQVRDVINAMYPMEESPGGHAAKHGSNIRIHLKPHKEKWKGIVNGEEIQIGFRAVAVLKKNKTGAPNQKAEWNFWNYPNPDGIVGIDQNQEIYDLALRLGVIDRAGRYYSHPSFPVDKQGNNRVDSKEAVAELLKTDPAVRLQIREDVLATTKSLINGES